MQNVVVNTLPPNCELLHIFVICQDKLIRCQHRVFNRELRSMLVSVIINSFNYEEGSAICKSNLRYSISMDMGYHLQEKLYVPESAENKMQKRNVVTIFISVLAFLLVIGLGMCIFFTNKRINVLDDNIYKLNNDLEDMKNLVAELTAKFIRHPEQLQDVSKQLYSMWFFIFLSDSVFLC